MALEIKKRALNTLAGLADWIEEQNTEGAGYRWLEKAIAEFTKLARSKVQHSICKEPKLAKYNYRCFTYNNNWIVAYKIENNRFVIYRFIYGAWLNYKYFIRFKVARQEFNIS